MNSKLIFLDIDGTLTTPGSNIPPESALEAIRLAQRAGHKVFLCPGATSTCSRPCCPTASTGWSPAAAVTSSRGIGCCMTAR